MKKIILALAFLIASLNAGELMIKRDNGKVLLSFEKKYGLYVLSDGHSFDDNVEVIIVYNDDKSRKSIENKYSLMDGKDMYGMYIIYKQQSKDVIGLFAKLSKEKGIKNVYPNWTTRVKKY